MSGPGAARVDVHVGDVSHSQLVFGDHNTIQTPKGTKVTVLQVGERPLPRLRATPLRGVPGDEVSIVGRAEERRFAAAAAADAPVQFYAPDGAGKTALLKFSAQQTPTAPEGAVFRATRRRTLDDIRAELYTAFWETDVAFLPSPAEVGGFLADREALLVLDDCELDRDDLATLLDGVPRCSIVIASAERTLWRGTARPLTGLDPAHGVELLERELGEAVAAEERPAAEAVVARLEGHPQSLVETAALIADHRASFRELADDAAAFSRRLDPSALSGSQERILELLAALDGAPLGVEHVSTLAGVSNAEQELAELERRGWVKSASPRYRLARPADEGVAERSEALLTRLLDHLTRWSGESEPSRVADEAEAIEASLELATGALYFDQALALSLAAEQKLAPSGAWTAWRNVLTSGLVAARKLRDEAAEAHLLHQLGSRSLCLGADDVAAGQLTEALAIRERLGDSPGAELTRHNLGQIGGGGAGGGANGGGGPWLPWLGAVLAAVAIAVIVTVLATSGDGGGEGGDAGGDAGDLAVETTSELPPGAAPTITIESPGDGATFTTEDEVEASYACAAAEGAEVASCEGPVANGAGLDMSPGPHDFTVIAVDDAGLEAQQTVNYTVVESPPGDTTSPSIEIFSPGKSTNVGAEVPADYSCSDEEGGSGLASCTGTVANDELIDTSTEGEKTFTVTAVDNAGNESTESVTYSVFGID